MGGVSWGRDARYPTYTPRTMYRGGPAGPSKSTQKVFDMDLGDMGEMQNYLRRNVGKPGWTNLVGGWIAQMTHQGRERTVTPRATQIMTRLLQFAQGQDVNAYNGVLRQYGLDPSEGSQPGEELSPADFLAALGDAMSGAGAAARITAINRQVNILRNEASRTNITTDRTETTFIDVPTPEEFLNDFETGLTTHVQGLSRAGQLDPLTQDFIMQNQQFFFDRYIAELSARARAGQQIFKVVGLGVLPASNVFLGTRAGPTTTARSRGRETTTATETSKSQEQQQLEGGGSQPFSESTTTKEQVNRTFDNTTTERIRENLIQRPNLTTVFKMSPLQFLQMNYGENEFRQFYQGTKGQKQRMSEVAGGGPVSRARRVV